MTTATQKVNNLPIKEQNLIDAFASEVLLEGLKGSAPTKASIDAKLARFPLHLHQLARDYFVETLEGRLSK